AVRLVPRDDGRDRPRRRRRPRDGPVTGSRPDGAGGGAPGADASGVGHGAPADPRATGCRLVLLRHARAEDEGAAGDQMRALSLAGRAQAAQLGAALQRVGLRPHLVLCSSAMRTRQTWDLLRPGLEGPPPVVTMLDALYTAAPRAVLETVRDTPAGVTTLLVVGHEPAMSTLAGHLAGPQSAPEAVAQVGTGMPTAAFAVLEGPSRWTDWQRGCAVLRAVVRPD